MCYYFSTLNGLFALTRSRSSWRESKKYVLPYEPPLVQQPNYRTRRGLDFESARYRIESPANTPFSCGVS